MENSPGGFSKESEIRSWRKCTENFRNRAALGTYKRETEKRWGKDNFLGIKWKHHEKLEGIEMGHWWFQRCSTSMYLWERKTKDKGRELMISTTRVLRMEMQGEELRKPSMKTQETSHFFQQNVFFFSLPFVSLWWVAHR